jgi:hypothetical protein
MSTPPPKYVRDLRCIHVGCTSVGKMNVWPSAGSRNESITALDGWSFYANLNEAICPQHQHVALGGGLQAHVTDNTVFEIRDAGTLLGRISFPTNTRRLQVHGETDDAARLLAAGRKLVPNFDGFLPDT